MRLRKFGSSLVMILGMLAISAAEAGSERWIFSIDPAEMQQAKIVHVQFADQQGRSIDSDGLKQMVLKQGCDSGAPYVTPKDYRFGFSPEGKRVGLYLPAATWVGKKICFLLPGLGRLETTLSEENAGKSISLTLGQP